MKNKLWIGLVVAALIISAALPAISQTSKPLAVAAIDVKALQEMMQIRKVTLINVSGLLVCMDAKIPGSLCLTCDDKKDASVFSSLAKDSKIVFYAGSMPVNSECDLVNQTVLHGFPSVYILKGGLPAWRKAGHPVVSEKRIPRVMSWAISPGNLPAWLKQTKNPLMIDIRSAKVYTAGHLDGALNFPLTRLHVQYADIPLNRKLLIVDEDGTQSFLAVSYLNRKGFLNILRLKGGMAGYRRGAQ
jgi:rhodanese-related sulfurtransferase